MQAQIPAFHAETENRQRATSPWRSDLCLLGRNLAINKSTVTNSIEGIVPKLMPASFQAVHHANPERQNQLLKLTT